MVSASDSGEHHRNDTLSGPTLHTLLTTTAVIHANAQLLERWVRRTDPADAELVLARLAVITTMVWRLALELDALREAEPLGADPQEPSADP
jgi:hypothetical protein